MLGEGLQSTTLPYAAPPVVDGRAKPGHDTTGTPSRYLSAYAACPEYQAGPAYAFGESLETCAFGKSLGYGHRQKRTGVSQFRLQSVGP
jgi:hypothetical protein